MGKLTKSNLVTGPSKSDLLTILKTAKWRGNSYSHISESTEQLEVELKELEEQILAKHKRYQTLKKLAEKKRRQDEKNCKEFYKQAGILTNLVRLEGPTPQVVTRVEKFLKTKE